jgi:hypothetical protein
MAHRIYGKSYDKIDEAQKAEIDKVVPINISLAVKKVATDFIDRRGAEYSAPLLSLSAKVAERVVVAQHLKL